MTVLAFWATGTHVVPRFFSFLLVPLFMLVASGSASILARPPGRRQPVRTLVVVATFSVAAFLAIPLLVDVLRYPRDSTREAALTIKSMVPASAPVFAHVPYPNDLEFHLGRSVVPVRTAVQARAACTSDDPAVYVDQPYLLSPCPSRAPRDSARGGIASSNTPAETSSMSGSSLRPRADRLGRGGALVAAAYVVLGAALLWSRLYELGHSFWFDEVVTVADFVRPGPRQIMTGPGISHELYSLLAWFVSLPFGDSETALRLCSAIPFVLGVVVVTAWLHTRLQPLAGVLYLFLATVSPLLLDITRQARGYGLAFFAMSVLVVAALEATRTGQPRLVAVACGAGVVGAWTLPQFAIAFVPMCLVLAGDPRLRRAALVGVVVSMVLVAVWYAPHTGQVHASSQVPDGLRISTQWLLTAPFDFTVIPALVWIDGTAAVPGFVWLPFVLVAVVVMASSPLARERRTALVLGSGVVVVIAFLWIGRAYVIPRYVSFLLVPLFVLLASGASSILGRIGTRPQILRSLACLVLIAVLSVRFVSLAPDVVGEPREANRDAARLIETTAPATALVLTRMWRPRGLAFYLERPIHPLSRANAADRVCGSRVTVAYVVQPFALPPVSIPCLTRSDARRTRFRQYARGDEIDVWFVPPRRCCRG